MADSVDLKNQMNQLIRGYWTTQAIFVAAELRIATFSPTGRAIRTTLRTKPE